MVAMVACTKEKKVRSNCYQCGKRQLHRKFRPRERKSSRGGRGHDAAMEAEKGESYFGACLTERSNINWGYFSLF